MRVKIVAIGRLKSQPERVIFDDYRSRFNKLGKVLGLGPLEIIELDDRKTVKKAVEEADGLHHSVLDRCKKSISLGNMVWPHVLARVMLSEQLYRAATILAGTPYHRA